MASVSTFKELLAGYARGEREFIGCELDADPENDLSGIRLENIDLSESRVVAKFQGASLRGAKFCAANVKTCDFSQADVSFADFSGAALCATTFIGARMENTQFAGAYFHSFELKPGELPDW